MANPLPPGPGSLPPLEPAPGALDQAFALIHAGGPVVIILIGFSIVALAIEGQRRDYPEDAVREEAFRYGGDILETLRSGFRPLEVISTLAPLLGLFGTVLGMISAFQQLEAAGNQVNPAILSGGIWEALLTTAVGLAVAIPVIIVLNWLERMVESVTHEMDSVIMQLFTVDLKHPATNKTKHERAPFRHAAATAGE